VTIDQVAIPVKKYSDKEFKIPNEDVTMQVNLQILNKPSMKSKSDVLDNIFQA